MLKASPAALLLVLIGVGAGVSVFLSQKPAPKPVPVAAAPRKDLLELPKTQPNESPEEQEDLPAQIKLLEGQVEYLQGQVSTLQEENTQLLQKLGTLGMKGAPKMEPVMVDEDPPDYVGMGIELMKFRKLQALPIPTTGVSQAEVERAILAWLRQQQPDDEGPRFGLALTALGWIEKPVDPLPLRAALWARQLGGWYDEGSGTLLVTEENPIPGKPVPDRPMAIAFGQLLRQYGSTLFPKDRTEPLTTDERLARESLLAGDAGLTRFLFSLQNPEAAPKSDLPAEDPDHPLNEVAMPVFLKELALFPFRPGFEFAQTLHSAGEFGQLNAAYSRPPRDCAEIIEVERYLDNSGLPSSRPQFASTRVGDSEPYWDDSLGRFAVFNALRTYNSDEDSGQAARGWQSDRLLAYAAPDHPRDHAAWQTQWLTPAQAEAFFKAMRNCLLQRYDAEPVKDTAEEVMLAVGGRTVQLLRNRQGQGVLLVDAATAEFAQALRSTLDSVSKAAP
ncbi:MAG: hypothetical protein V4599_12480 [Verrucomicrobiota bacterium]